MSGLSLEYAKSGRSKCKSCKALLAEGSLRIGQSRNVGDFSQTSWFHLSCLPTSNAFRSLSAATIPGFKELKKKDQTAVRKLLVELCEEAEEQLADKSGPAKRSKSKGRQRKAGEGWKGYTTKQMEEFREMKKQLAGVTMEELKSMCRKNDQKVTGNKGELVERVADECLAESPNAVRVAEATSASTQSLAFTPVPATWKTQTSSTVISRSPSAKSPAYLGNSSINHLHHLLPLKVQS